MTDEEELAHFLRVNQPAKRSPLATRPRPRPSIKTVPPPRCATPPALLLAVDPGVRQCGVALFRDGVLVAAGLPRGDPDASMSREGQRGPVLLAMSRAVAEWAAPFGRVTDLVIEMPQAYEASSQKGDQNDLIHLAAVVGAVIASLPDAEVTVCLPFGWKKQIPKSIHHPRAMKRLRAEEIAVIPLRPRKGDVDHNIMDAVALGLTRLRRLG